MRPLQFTAVKLSGCLILGIIIGYGMQPPLWLSITLAPLLLLLLGREHFKGVPIGSLRFGIVAALLTVTIGMFSFSLTEPTNNPNHYRHFIHQGDQAYTLKIREVLKPTPYSDRYVAQVLSVAHTPVTGEILLQIIPDSGSTKHQVDDELVAFTQILPVPKPLNPFQFDYGKYLSHLGISHQTSLRPQHYFQQKNPRTTVFGAAAGMREHIIAKLKKEAFGDAELGIIQALLLGQRNDIAEDTQTDYKNAGAYHILALSGLHIGVILGLLHVLLQPLTRLPKGKTIKLVLIIFLLWGFAFLAGLSPSILRAVGMFTFVAYALHLKRPTSYFNILALSLFSLLLIFDPRLLFQVGFQLSYAAVFAIVWIHPLIQKRWAPKNGFFNKIWQVLSVSFAAQLGVLPITFYYFHQFPGLFFISSLLVLPVLGFILGMGLLVIFLALINALPAFLVQAYDLLIRAMNRLINWIAQQETFIFREISFDAIQMILTYAIIFSFVGLLAKTSYKRVTCLLIGIIGLQIWGLTAHFWQGAQETLMIGHLPRNSTIAYQQGRGLTLYTHDSLAPASKRWEADYALARRVGRISRQPLKNSYQVGTERLLVVDSSLRSWPATSEKPTVLLTQSPRVNLDRLIDSIRPKMIIADGNNYKTYVARWEATCAKRKLPFHYTGEEGTFILNLD